MFVGAFATACARPQYRDTNQSPPSFDPQQNDFSCPLVSTTKIYCLSFEWQKFPTQDEMGSFLFSFFKPGTKILQDPPAQVSVTLWMPSMGHGSSPVQVEKRSTGDFLATHVYFIMPGTWEIHIQIKNETGEVLDQVIQKIQI